MALQRELPAFDKLTARERKIIGIGPKAATRTPEQIAWEQADKATRKGRDDARKRSERGKDVAEWE